MATVPRSKFTKVVDSGERTPEGGGAPFTPPARAVSDVSPEYPLGEVPKTTRGIRLGEYAPGALRIDQGLSKRAAVTAASAPPTHPDDYGAHRYNCAALCE